MAYYSSYQTRVLPAPVAIFTFFDRAVRLFEQNREQNRIADELHQMSTRELADLGLTESDIPDVANGSYRRD